ARERLIRLLEEAGRFEEALAERGRSPALPGVEGFRIALEQGGPDAYRRVVREGLLRDAQALEVRILERHPTSVNDIHSPPLVRLVSLLARLGDWKRARSWRLQGIAERPALARWFASIPELHRDGLDSHPDSRRAANALP